MSNMSYVMFQNTLRDLRECNEALDEIGGDLTQLSDSERKAAEKMIEICKQIAEQDGEE